MIIETYSKKSPLKNKIEDAYAINRSKQIFAVFDGVTPLDSSLDANEENGARKASTLFKKHFEQEQISTNIAEELTHANTALHEQMKQSGVDLVQKHLLWSTCAAVIHIGEETVQYAQLGDCMIIASDRLGHVHVLTKNQVVGLEERAQIKREKDRANGIYVPEERFFEDGWHQESYLRWMANSPEGYGVANGMKEMKNYIQTGETALAALDSILLISDGLFELDGSCQSVMEQVKADGLEAYAERLRQRELERNLRIDDKTGIFIQFS